MAGNATRTAAESLKDRATELAALRWNCDAKDLSYDDGAVQRDSDRLTLQELAAFAETRGETLSADALFDNEKKMSYSYGAHAAQIAIDIATGVVEVERYWPVAFYLDDPGSDIDGDLCSVRAVRIGHLLFVIEQGIGGECLAPRFSKGGKFLEGQAIGIPLNRAIVVGKVFGVAVPAQRRQFGRPVFQ